MRVEQLDYELPPELIAQTPIEPRDESRLIVLNRAAGTIRHQHFLDLPRLLEPGDCLVVNDSRVIPARVRGWRVRTGGRWEGLFLRERATGEWELLCQTRGRPELLEEFAVDGHDARLVLRGRTSDGHWLMEPSPPQRVHDLLDRIGHVPLPPYIRGGRDEPADRDRYQTVFASRDGAVAAPTAGLHFTPRLLDAVHDRGIELIRLTLHVGVGTFEPIRQSVESHAMHAEWGELTAEAAARIEARRRQGGRIVAVGSTSVRVLETAAAAGRLEAWCGETSIFIRPPYEFRAVDAMITNFHLPRTTLLALVFAFAGESLARRAYDEAIRERYRFYSFGDAMLIT